jgi:ADP-ribosylglycohydrolase
MELSDRFRGCLLGGAIGDALGYPVEFLSRRQIMSLYGTAGLTDLIVDGESGKALISDDTQMTLFTANAFQLWKSTVDSIDFGSLSGTMPNITQSLYKAYQRWYYTQSGDIRHRSWLDITIAEGRDDFIMEQKELFAQRAPGNTCLSALRIGMGTMEKPLNNSKGCGGIMRVAPIGLYYKDDPVEAFRIGCKAAAITHGHPSGYLAAGAFAMLIALIAGGRSLSDSLDEVLDELETRSGGDETAQALTEAQLMAVSGLPAEKAIAALGEGWVAEEALAIAVYRALGCTDFESALIMSVNHDGDSDSTGAICGNIMGCLLGKYAIPVEWCKKVELSDFVVRMSMSLLNGGG